MSCEIIVIVIGFCKLYIKTYIKIYILKSFQIIYNKIWKRTKEKESDELCIDPTKNMYVFGLSHLNMLQAE